MNGNKKIVSLAIVGALCLAINPSDATLHRFLSRRYAPEPEESTTTTSSGDKPARLYPDLTIPPGIVRSDAPQMGLFPAAGAFLPSGIRGPTPFLPFGPPLPGAPTNLGPLNMNYQQNFPFAKAENAQLNDKQQPPNQDVFSTTLGERLLKLANGGSAPSNMTESRQVFQNPTVLEQLNRGVHSVYDNLAKAYNSTIQRQVELLQEKLRNTTNGSNPWQQRWADQLGQFYKSMANRASQAQLNMNAAWNQFRNANANDLQKSLQQQSPFANLQASPSDNFLADLQRSINSQVPTSLDQLPGMGPDGVLGAPQRDLNSQLHNFWNVHVTPQMDTARNIIARTWHDLTASGVYNPLQMGNPTLRSRNANNNNTASSAASSSGGDFVDNILDMVNLGGPEYTMIEQDNSIKNNTNRDHGFRNAMQNRILSMQRDINQLWRGITSSLQSTLGSVQTRMMNPAGLTPPAGSDPKNDAILMDQDPAENEINAKLRDIDGLQKDADKVYNAVQREQQNQMQQQQQATMSERLKNFYNHLHVNDNLHKIGHGFTNLWNGIPDRWNNMMNNVRQSSATTSTSKPMI